MRPGALGMIFDRALTPTLLDVGLRVATEHNGAANARRLLTVALRDHVSAQEAEHKTKKVLTRVWVVPPSPAAEMIRWAIERQASAGDRMALHFVAILATFPFAGSVASFVGRHLHLDGKVEPRKVRAEARSTFGDRSTIDVGARKVLTTMRYLGLLDGPDGGPFSAGRERSLSPEFSGWILHALLLTRQAESISIDEPSRAFELATLQQAGTDLSNYPLLELHTEGTARSVAVVRGSADTLRPSPKSEPVKETQRQLKFEIGQDGGAGQ